MSEAETDRAPPTGQRFSHVYAERGQPGEDSQRMRRRLASLIGSIDELEDLGQRAEGELGIPATWTTHQPWRAFTEKWELKDVLDLVTIAARHLDEHHRGNPYVSHKTPAWVREVNRIFEEENLHYRVDSRGGVHFYPDKEYALNSAAAIAALQRARYANALAEFEAGRAALTSATPDGKSAIRSTFLAVEGVFRLMFPSTPRLTAGEAEKLQKMLDTVYAKDPTALRAASKMLKAFQDWIDGAHFYRHAQGTEEVVHTAPCYIGRS